MVKLVDTLDLGSSASRRGGSSPSTRTHEKFKYKYQVQVQFDLIWLRQIFKLYPDLVFGFELFFYEKNIDRFRSE